MLLGSTKSARALPVAVLLTCFVLASCRPVFGQAAAHLWYNDPGPGDLMLLDVKVTSTAVTTYYESLGWNQGGEAGGYTGIQSHPNGNAYIFSIWDPVAVKGIPIKAVYSKPGSTIARFGGEGTGLRYLDFSTGWTRGKPVTSAVKSWPYKGHTYFGMWTRDSATSMWTHHATFDFPVAGVKFNYGAMSFIENWTGQDAMRRRRAEFFNGWKRSDGKWSAFTIGEADPTGAFGVTASKRYFLQTGGTPVVGFKNPLKSPTLSTAPSLPAAQVTQVSTAWDKVARKLNVAWIVSNTGAPQFSYRIQIKNLTTNTTIATVNVIAPETRSFKFDLSKISSLPDRVRATVTITDLIDRTISVTKDQNLL